MGIFFLDSVPYTSTTYMVLGRWTVQSLLQFETNTPRTGVNCFKTNWDTQRYTYKDFLAVEKLYVGFIYYQTYLGNMTSNYGWRIGEDDGTYHITFVVLSDGSIEVRRGSYNGTLLDTSATGVISDSTWHYVELYGYPHDTLGEYKLKVDGVVRLSDTGIDTQNGGTPECSRFYIGGSAGSTSANGKYSDIYMADDGFYGPLRITPIRPDGAGNYTQWTPSAGSNYTCVDESGNPSTSDYVEASSKGLKDSYTFGDISLSTGENIRAVQVSNYSDKGDVYVPSMKHLVRIGTSDYILGDERVDSGKYRNLVLNVSPDTASAWSESEVNGSEFGYVYTGTSTTTTTTT